MPPSKKFQREDIIQAACDIVQNEGIEELNTRRIAKELQCSTQPIYHNFDTVEQLKSEVIEKIYHIYVSYMKKGGEETKAYLGMGMAYIRFAMDYPNFFKALFMAESGMSPVDFIKNDDMGNNVLQKGRLFSGLTHMQQEQFHLKVWIFTHGLAVLAANHTVRLTYQEIETLLASTTKEMLAGFQSIQKQEEETNGTCN